MKKLIVLVFIILYNCCGSSTQTSNLLPQRSQFTELHDLLSERVNNFKLDFHRSFEETRIKRKQKDNFLYSLPDRGILIEEHLKVENASEVFSSNYFGNEAIRTWTVIETIHYTYLFWGLSNGKLILADFKVSPIGPQTYILAEYIERENGVPLKSQYFLYESFIWLVVAFRSKGREYLAVYQFNHINKSLHRRQTIDTDVNCDFDITSKGITYMAVSSYMRKTPVGQTLQSTLKLYEWRHTQFDFIAEQKTSSATSVKLFNMAGTLYMAVTQVNDNSNIHIDNNQPKGSPVFLYNAREDERLTYVQIIPTHSAIKVEHFKVDGNDYLIFVEPKEDARIYWWAGDQFLHYQDLQETRYALSVGVVRLPNAEILLALLYKDRIKFFTESVSSKYVMNGELIVRQPASFETIKLFSYVQNYYFSLFTFSGYKSPISSLWRLTLVNHEIKDSYDYDPLRSCLTKFEQTLSQREMELKDLTLKADRVWLSNRPQNVSAPVIVKGKLKMKGLSAKLLTITNPNKVSQITNSYVKARIDKVSNTLDNIVRDMSNVVYKSKNQTINGRIIFTEGLNAGNVRIGNIANTNFVINKIPFSVLSDNSLKVNGNQVINAHFSFNNIIANNLDIRGLINNLNISDALLNDWPHLQIVTGDHRYGNILLQSDLLLNNQFGSLNGISPSEFVTKSGVNQQINGRKVFQLLEAKNIDVKGTTNGKDLSDIANKAVLLNGPNQVMTGQLIMESPIEVKRIKLNGLINRVVNVSEIAFNAVTIYGDQKITGRKTFRGAVSIVGSAEIGGKVNGIKLSTDVITTNTNQVLTGNLTFNSLVEFMNNVECDAINNIDLSEDVVQKNITKPQYVSRKTFNETLVVLRDITMDIGSTIDGVDPSELLKLVITSNNVVFEAPISFDRLRVGGNIFAQSINHYPITDLPNILWLKSANQTIAVPVKFEGLVKVNDLFSRDVNRFKVPDDFVRKTGFNEVIYGEKTFVNNVLVNGNIAIEGGKKVNGIDLQLFDKRHVKKDTNFIDYISGIKHFRSIRVEGNVVVANVNGFNISEDIMLVNKNQTINGNIRFIAPLTLIDGHLEVMGNINVRSTVNNVSLSQFANELVLVNRWSKRYQRPIRNKVFAGGIGAHHMRVDGTINGININEMKARVVTLDTEQLIVSSKNFTGITYFENDLKSEYLNGLRIREYFNRVVLKDQMTRVRGSKTLKGEVLLKSNLELSGNINKINVRSLQRRIMSRTRNNVILAPITFNNDINATQLVLEPPATIDGLRPSDLALIGDHLRFDGHIVINRGSTVSGDILVRKLVNGCDLRKLAAEAIFQNSGHSQQNIYGMKQFVNLEVLGDVLISGPLNNVNINDLTAKMVTLSGNQVLSAPLIFENDIEVESLIIRNLINGRNISFLFEDVVLKNKIQNIFGRKTFLKGFFANGSHFRVVGDVRVDGLVDGIDVVKLNQTIVRQYNNKEISGTKSFAGIVTFKSDVFTAGSVSGIKIPNDLILVNTSELIPGLTTFNNLITCKKDINVRKLINGIDLSDFVRNRMTLSDKNELITSFLNFTTPITVDNLIVRNTINNIPINSLVTRRGRHLINGVKTFVNDVHINGNLRSPGVYNGINIHDLVQRSVSLYRPEVIPGTTQFTSPVSMHHMAITGLLNGYDISHMANFFDKFTAEVDSTLLQIRDQLSRQENRLLSQFDSVLIDRSTGLKYFQISQELYETGERFLINSIKSPNDYMKTYPTDGLLLWNYKAVNNENCRFYSTITYKISDNGFISSESTPEFGRNIPLIHEEIHGKHDLLLWTNTTSCHSLSRGKTLMKTIHIDDITSLYSKRHVFNDKYPSHVTEAPLLKDAKLFVSNNQIYVILAQNYNPISKSFHTNSTVIWLNSKTGHWSQIQQIETFGVHSIDVIKYSKDQTIFAAFANRFKVRSNDIHSVIMRWNSGLQKFDINTVIQTSNPSSVIFVETNSGQLYALFANEKSTLFETDCDGNDYSLYTQPIDVYHYNSNHFELIQSIDINGVVSLETFSVSNETYIVAASRLLATTYVLQLRGYNMFEVILSFSTPGVENVKTFWSNDGSLHLAIASSKSGHSKILKAVINDQQSVKKYSHIEQLLQDSNLK